MPFRSLFHDTVVFLVQEDRAYFTIAALLSLLMGCAGLYLYQKGPVIAEGWNNYKRRALRLWSSATELHENLTQILHVNTRTVHALQDFQSVMTDMADRCRTLQEQSQHQEFNRRLHAVEQLLQRWDTALGQQLQSDLHNVLQTLERLCILVAQKNDDNSATIHECRDISRAVLQQSRVLEALLRAEPFPTAPVRYHRPPIGDA